MDPRGPFLIPLILLAVARLVMWKLVPPATEDAYITYRYARNLASGHGLVYNPHERVMGFSSPLWTVWIAVGQLLLGNPVTWSRLWGMVADALTLVTMGGLLLRHASRTSAWCFTFFLAAWPYYSALSNSGMENGVLLALTVLAAALVGAGSMASGPVLAALALTRPEGVATAGLLALGARWRDRISAAVLAALGFGALWSYFGTIVPQSVLAKARIYGMDGPWEGRHWWEWAVPFPAGRWPAQGDTSNIEVLTVLMAPAAAIGAATLWKQRGTPLARAVAASLLVWLGYSASGVMYFWWYLGVPLAGFAALAAVGLPRIARGRAVFVSCALFVLGIWTIAPRLYIGRAQVEFHRFGRAGTYLRDHCRPGEKVMLEPIGMIGYAAPLVVLDEVGLVSPRVAERRLRGSGWYADLVEAERPEWLAVRVGVMRTGTGFAGVGDPFRNLAERDSVLARYEVADRGDEESGDNAIEVLRRVR